MLHRVERSEDKWGFFRVWEPCPFERFQRADLSPWRLEACTHLMWGWLYAWSLSDRPELWCYFPSSDVLCAFYQLFCPAHVGFMNLHLSFLWCLYLALPSLGAIHSGCCPEASSFCSPLGAEYSGAVLAFAWLSIMLAMEDVSFLISDNLFFFF